MSCGPRRRISPVSPAGSTVGARSVSEVHALRGPRRSTGIEEQRERLGPRKHVRPNRDRGRTPARKTVLPRTHAEAAAHAQALRQRLDQPRQHCVVDDRGRVNVPEQRCQLVFREQGIDRSDLRARRRRTEQRDADVHRIAEDHGHAPAPRRRRATLLARSRMVGQRPGVEPVASRSALIGPSTSAAKRPACPGTSRKGGAMTRPSTRAVDS